MSRRESNTVIAEFAAVPCRDGQKPSENKISEGDLTMPVPDYASQDLGAVAGKKGAKFKRAESVAKVISSFREWQKETHGEAGEAEKLVNEAVEAEATIKEIPSCEAAVVAGLISLAADVSTSSCCGGTAS